MTLSVKQGTYTGDGNATQAITGVGFQPKVVFVRELVQTVGDDGGSFRIDTMGTNEGKKIGANGAVSTDGVRVLGTDGFTVGNGASVNASGVAYYYLALGGDDVATGSYTGNDTDNRNITGVGFQPVWVGVAASGNTFAYFKPSSLAGDASHSYSATANQANRIQALQSDGFQVGTEAEVNTGANTYYWFAIKSSSKIVLNSYSGDGVDSTNITTVGFYPQAVIVKEIGAQPGIMRVDSLTGDNTIKFTLAGAANLIQNLNSNGFQVGNDNASNGTGGTYHYIAFTQSIAQTITSSTYIHSGEVSRQPRIQETQYNLPNIAIVQNTPKITNITNEQPRTLFFS